MKKVNQYLKQTNKINEMDSHFMTEIDSFQIDIIPDITIFPSSENEGNKSSELDIEVIESIRNLKEEDFMIDENEIVFQKQQLNEKLSKPLEQNNSICNYYEVLSVSGINSKKKTKTIRLTLIKPKENEVIRHSEVIKVKLEGLWYETIIEANDKVYLLMSISNYDPSEKCYLLTDSNNKSFSQSSSLYDLFTSINTLENFIVIYPELLLSPSLIKSGFPCSRKAFFNEEFKFIFGNEFNKNLLIGSIVHSLFEIMFHKVSLLNSNMTQRQLSSSFLEEELKVIMKGYYLDIALLDLAYADLYSECKCYITQIINFFNDFYFAKCSMSGLKINKLIGSEQLYQSQVLGMKGVIDILIETTNEKNTKEITPFELKTGYYQSNSDIMQVLIYCLILSEQLGSSSSNGLLYYLKKDTKFRVKVTMNDIINVIVVRNNIAKYIHKYENTIDLQVSDWAPLYGNAKECEGCYKKLMCKSHYGLYEESNDNDNLFQKQFVGSQPDKIQEYFRYFYSIINNEQVASNQQLMLQYLKINDNTDLNEFTKYEIVRISDNNHSFGIDINGISEDCLRKGEESQQEVISQYKEIRDSYVIYDPKCKMAFKAIVSKKNSNGRLMLNVLKYQLNQKLQSYLLTLKREQNKGVPLDAYLYMKNIDSLSKFSFKLMRGNLLSFCSIESNALVDRLRRMIIFQEAPSYNNDKTFKINLIKYLKEKFYDKYVLLNQNQKSALIKSLVCEDYALIIGFPGSGKTTVIALLIEILSSMNKKILVTAHTNIAVDNILLKLKEGNKTSFCRIGSNLDVIHKDIHDYVLSNSKIDSVTQWKTFLNKQTVYATTTLGITNKLLSKITFDYCVVDEACQAFEPSLLGPIMLSNKFILVGDPFQLRALLKGSNASTPTSLFERLLNAHQSMAEQLEFQYRMNESILRLSNECVYENVMRCANDAIAQRKIGLNMNRLISPGKNIPLWVKDIINPSRAVVLVDYSSYNDINYFNKVIDSNEIEVNIINELMKALSYCKFNLDDIGILTPYKKQERLLRKKLKLLQFDNILTIDKSQGIEKEIIIISMVKTNTITKLLKDIARINVAFTRPRSKLIIIGLRDVLIEIEKLSAYINLLIKLKWIYPIEKSDILSLMNTQE